MRGRVRAALGRAIGPASGLGTPFYLLFLSGVLSDIGGFTTHTALVLHVFKLTGGSTRFMGLIAMASLLPMVLSAPLGGVWAERYPRLRVMIGNDLVRMPLILGMIFTDSVWLLLLLQALVCASTALFMPSRQSILPELVPPEHLELANALNGGVLSVVHVLSPLIGAFLYARVGSLAYVVVIEALAYLVSALLLSRIVESPRPPRAGAEKGMFGDIVDGFRYVRGEADLRQIFIMLLASGIALGLLIPLLRPFASQALRGGDATYAAMITWFGVGGLFGPLIGYLVGRWLGLGRALTLSFCLEALVLTLWPRSTAVWQASAGLFAWGIVMFAMIPCYTSYLHIYARKEFMGRTFGLFDQTGYLPQIAAAALITALGDRLPVVLILTCAGALYLGIVLLTLPSRGGRLLRGRSGARPGLSSGAHPPVSG
jgi:predicted MFS family arabinose efflux permease